MKFILKWKPSGWAGNSRMNAQLQSVVSRHRNLSKCQCWGDGLCYSKTGGHTIPGKIESVGWGDIVFRGDGGPL